MFLEAESLHPSSLLASSVSFVVAPDGSALPLVPARGVEPACRLEFVVDEIVRSSFQP